MRGFRKDLGALEKSDTLDLWVELWEVIGIRGGEVDLRWAKSHPTSAQAGALGVTWMNEYSTRLAVPSRDRR